MVDVPDANKERRKKKDVNEAWGRGGGM